MEKTLEDKINDIHDFTIRMEPIIEDVKSLKKWRDGNGLPGAREQVRILWLLAGGGWAIMLLMVAVKLGGK